MLFTRTLKAIRLSVSVLIPSYLMVFAIHLLTLLVVFPGSG
jgi:hypothetical protein